jgi:hypothetical protein
MATCPKQGISTKEREVKNSREIRWFADKGGPVHTIPDGVDVAFVMRNEDSKEGRVTLKFDGDKVSVTRFTMEGEVSVQFMSLVTRSEDVLVSETREPTE